MRHSVTLGLAVTFIAAATVTGQPVTESFTYQGRTLLYRYDPAYQPDSGGQAGVLLQFHGHSSGTQEDMLHLPAFTQSIATEEGLIYVKLASPALWDGTLGGDGTRHWHFEDIPLIHEFLQTELPSKFSFDSDRIVFWGGSQGTCFLNDFISSHGTSYGGGLFAQCGCFNLDPTGMLETARDFKDRFRVVVQATTGDFLYAESIEAYWFYKYENGLETFGDLGRPGGHCAPGAIGADEAIGWILGTRRLGTNDSGERLERQLPLQPKHIKHREDSIPSDCPYTLDLNTGEGDPLWFPVREDGIVEIPPQMDLEWVTYHLQALAGTGESGYSGDGGPAAKAQLNNPTGIAADAAGNVFVADTFNRRVRRIDAATGVIETIAGTGESGYSGDGGPATEARLNRPYGVAVDAASNVFVADTFNHRVRRIDAATGVIETIAGTGVGGFSGDGGPATEARLSEIGSVAVDAAGNVFVADFDNHRVRRIDAATGVIETIAGTGESGYSGDGGPATEARLSKPAGVAVDAAGNVFVADTLNHRVRRVDAATGVIETIAGTGVGGFSGAGGPATEAQLSGPYQVAVDVDGKVLFIDSRALRVIQPNGRIYTSYGSVTAIATDTAGNVYTTQYPSRATFWRRKFPVTFSVPLENSGEVIQLRWTPTGGMLTPHGSVVLAGMQVAATSGEKYALSQRADGEIVAARVADPPALRISAETAEPGDRRIRSFAGTGQWGYSGDGGPATEARLAGPYAVAVDAAGNVFVADVYSHLVRRVDAATGVIETIAGTGESGYSGDGGPATEGRLSKPAGVAVDAAGNVFVADFDNHRVRRVDAATGVIETIAGTGTRGYSGDGGLATEAQLAGAYGVAVDAAGNVFVADTFNRRVRRVDAATGVIETIAGTGEWGYSGDGGPATEARLAGPVSVAVDAAGNVFVADVNHHLVRRVDAATGVIETIAGTGEWGYSGDGGPATQAQLSEPRAVAVDAAGNVFVADTSNHLVRRVDAATGVIETIAGTGTRGYSVDGGLATEAQLNRPYGVAVDADGNAYVTNLFSVLVVSAIRLLKVDVSLGSSGENIPFTISGEGVVTNRGKPMYDGTQVAACSGDIYALNRTANGALRATYVNEKQVVALSGQGRVLLKRNEKGEWWIGSQIARLGHRLVQGDREYFLDLAGGHWRLASHVMRTVAGHSNVTDGILSTAAKLYFPSAVATDLAGILYVADSANNRIRRIDAAGTIATFAGTGERGYSGDGEAATNARLDSPTGVAVDAAGRVYVADFGNQRVRRIGLDGIIETFAGAGTQGYSGDGGPAKTALLDSPTGVAVDAAGRVYVADFGNQRVRRIGLDGIIETFAGAGTQGYSGDGGPAKTALLDGPTGVAVDAAGRVYVADFGNQRVRRIGLDGIIETFAGAGTQGYSGDGGPAKTALLDGPTGVAADLTGRVYVADFGNQRVRRIDEVGVITTLAGNGKKGYSGDGGRASEALLHGPFGLATDSNDNVYVSEVSNHRIRRIDNSGRISTIAGTGVPFDRQDGGLAIRAQFSHALADVAVDELGNVYLADAYDHVVRQIDLAQMISTFGGSGRRGFGGDGGRSVEALLDSPSGVAADASGNVFVADTGNHRVRKIDASGTITTFAGTGKAGYSGEHLQATSSMLNLPERVAVDTRGNVYVLEGGNNRVRVVAPSGTIRTFAGNGNSETVSSQYLISFFTGSEANRIPLFGASDLAVGSSPAVEARLYLGEFSEGTVLRPVNLDSGRVVASHSFAESGGIVTGMTADDAGNVYFADGTGIRRLGADGLVSMIADLNHYEVSVAGMAVDRFGRIWFSDPEHRRVRVLEPVH